jgi:hypothetical protein
LGNLALEMREITGLKTRWAFLAFAKALPLAEPLGWLLEPHIGSSQRLGDVMAGIQPSKESVNEVKLKPIWLGVFACASHKGWAGGKRKPQGRGLRGSTRAMKICFGFAQRHVDTAGVIDTHCNRIYIYIYLIVDPKPE